MKTVTADQMRKLDARCIAEAGIPGDILMERAGKGACKHIIEFADSLYQDHSRSFLILAGKGNNGGDAYVVAKELFEKRSKKVKIFSVCPLDELKGDAAFHASKVPIEIFCEIRNSLSESDFRPGDIIIDGLLGTGFQGQLRAPISQWITTARDSGLPVVALDIPSGLDADGKVPGPVLGADLTITMGLPKVCFVVPKTSEYCGMIRCVDLGIPKRFIDEINSDIEFFMEEDARLIASRIPPNAHKKSRGVLSVFGGSADYPGAPLLTASAACRSGSGYVNIAYPCDCEASRLNAPLSIVRRALPNDGKARFCSDSIPDALKIISSSDAIVVGPGMGADRASAVFLEEIMKSAKKILLDADALNILSENPGILPDFPQDRILTPHPGEMKRLLDAYEISCEDSDRIGQAAKLAKRLRSVVVLKGRGTVVSDGAKTSVNSSGTPSLATAGSGDVLSGIIGSFLAQGISAFDSARLGVFIHGFASEISNSTRRSLIADDLIDLCPQAMKRISPLF